MLIAEGTYFALMAAAIFAVVAGVVGLGLIIRAAPRARRRMPSLFAPIEPPDGAAASWRTGAVPRALAAASVFGGFVTAAWLYLSNGRVLVVEEDQRHSVATRWMRQLGDAVYAGHGRTIQLVRATDGVLLVNASSRPVRVRGSGTNELLDGPSENWIIAPGDTTIVPIVDYLGDSGPDDLMQFLHGWPGGPTRYWVHWDDLQPVLDAPGVGADAAH